MGPVTTLALETRTLPEVHAAVVCACCRVRAVDDALGEALAEVREGLDAAGVDVAGPPFVAWANVYEDGTAEARIGWPVGDVDVELPSPLALATFPPARALVHHDVGAYAEVLVVDPVDPLV